MSHGYSLRWASATACPCSLYGQPEFRKTDLSFITVETLISLLRSLKPGVSEVSCHPGHLERRPDAFYNREREIDLQVLTDPRVQTAPADAGLRQISDLDYPRLARPVGTMLAGCPPVPAALRR
jgi:hypothetical protein